MDYRFSNLAEFISAAVNEETPRQGAGSRCEPQGPSWDGGEDFAGAVNLARNGWESGRDEVERRRADFERLTGHKTKRATLSRDVAGFAPDVPAFLNGEPESMFSREVIDADAPGKIIRVAISAAYRCNVSGETVTARGAMICAFIDEMEARGHRCELVAVFTSSAETRGRGLKNRVAVELKRAEEPLEIDRVAFALAHPAMFRRLVFSIRETDLSFQKSGDYGFSYDDPAFVEHDLFIPTLTENASDAQQLAYLKAQLAPLGITFDE